MTEDFLARLEESIRNQSDIEKLRGDINHLVQPIIGSLRMAAHRGDWEHFQTHADHYIDRLFLVLGLMDEAVTGIHVDDDHRARHGVGQNHYPSLVAPSNGDTDLFGVTISDGIAQVPIDQIRAWPCPNTRHKGEGCLHNMGQHELSPPKRAKCLHPGCKCGHEEEEPSASS